MSVQPSTSAPSGNPHRTDPLRDSPYELVHGWWGRVGTLIADRGPRGGNTEAEPALRGTVQIGGAAEIMTLRVLPALAPLTGRGLYLHATFGLAHDLLVDLAADRLDLVVSAIRPTHHALLAVPLADEEFLPIGPRSMARTVDRGPAPNRTGRRTGRSSPTGKSCPSCAATGAASSATVPPIPSPSLPLTSARSRRSPLCVSGSLTWQPDGENSEREGAPPCRPDDGTYTAEKARGFSGTSTVPTDEQGGDSTQGRWLKTLGRCGNQMMLTP